MLNRCSGLLFAAELLERSEVPADAADFVIPVTRVMPSYGVQLDRARAQRAVTDRFSASFNRRR